MWHNLMLQLSPVDAGLNSDHSCPCQKYNSKFMPISIKWLIHLFIFFVDFLPIERTVTKLQSELYS